MGSLGMETGLPLVHGLLSFLKAAGVSSFNAPHV